MQKRSSSSVSARQFEPVSLPAEFPITGSGIYQQGDRTITHLHLHDCLEVGYCHAGHGIFIVEGKIMPYGKGDVCVITEHEMHYAQSTTGTTSDWTFLQLAPVLLCQVDPKALPYFSMRGLSGPEFTNIFSAREYPDISRQIETLVREMDERRDGYQEAVKGLVRTLMVDIHRLRDGNAITEPEHVGVARVATALQVIGERFAESLQMEELAALCHLSVAHFRRLFTEAVGQSPKQYLGKLRVQVAASLLLSTDRSILQIALESGYPTLSTFNRAFRATTGMTPRQWRKQG